MSTTERILVKTSIHHVKTIRPSWKHDPSVVRNCSEQHDKRIRPSREKTIIVKHRETSDPSVVIDVRKSEIGDSDGNTAVEQLGQPFKSLVDKYVGMISSNILRSP